jgi:hypothetical protein
MNNVIPLIIGIFMLVVHFYLMWKALVDRVAWSRTWNWKSKTYLFLSLPWFLFALGLVFSYKRG